MGVPVGIFTAVFMAKFCSGKLYKILKPAVDLLAGIPSVVYGFFGMVVLVPMVRNIFGGNGNSILTASLLLGIMILPTIIGVSESAIRAVPDSYYEGPREKCVFYSTACGEIRYFGRCGVRDRKSHRRDYGGCHGRGKPGQDADGTC